MLLQEISKNTHFTLSYFEVLFTPPKTETITMLMNYYQTYNMKSHFFVMKFDVELKLDFFDYVRSSHH